MNITPIIMEGERVKLLPLDESHIDGLFAAGTDPRIWEVSMKPILSRSDAERFVGQALDEQDQGNGLPFAVWDHQLQAIVGSTRLFDISAAHRQLEIGHTWYQPSVWRSRVNTECKYLLLRHCFETLGTIRVQLKTDLRNTRSQAAISRLGAVREGVLRQHRILHDGYIRDTVMFSITDQEWPSVKARLEQYLFNN